MDDYVRAPIPDVYLTSGRGRRIHLLRMARDGAVLLVFASTGVERDVALESALRWEDLLPTVRVRVVVPSNELLAHTGKESAATKVLVDRLAALRDALGSGSEPMAVLLGTDHLLAGGPVEGWPAIHAFVRAVGARLRSMVSPTRVLITSAAMGSHNSNSVVLPQIRDGKHLVVDFACFNDSTRPTRERAMHPRLAGKIPKMLAWEIYPGYDYYLWMDSCFSMSRPDAVAWFLDQLGDHDAAFFRHHARTTVANELEFVLSGMQEGNQYLLDRYRGEDMEGQVQAYFGDPTFPDTFLIEAGAFIYSARIVQDVRSNVMKEWFHQNCRWSVQDQLSLPFVIHQFGTDAGWLDGTIYDCAYLR